MTSMDCRPGGGGEEGGGGGCLACVLGASGSKTKERRALPLLEALIVPPLDSEGHNKGGRGERGVEAMSRSGTEGKGEEEGKGSTYLRRLRGWV